jgi:hypothetical protein
MTAGPRKLKDPVGRTERSMPPRWMPLVLMAVAAMACLPAPALGRSGAHVHGEATLDVSIDGDTLVVRLTAPLDTLAGFERAPRTDAERQIASGVLARLRDTRARVRPDEFARCQPTDVAVAAPVLDDGERVDPADAHADAEVTWTFECGEPARLRSLDLGLFEEFPRLNRIDARVVGPRGAVRSDLRKPSRRLQLVR